MNPTGRHLRWISVPVTALLLSTATLAWGSSPVGATLGQVAWTVSAGSGGDPGVGFADGAAATAAALGETTSIAFAPDGSFYATAYNRQVVHVIGGKVYHVAGGGNLAPADGGTATAATLAEPLVAVGPTGTPYVTSGDALFTVTADHKLSAVPWSIPASEPPTAGSRQIWGLDVDASGRILLVDDTSRVRRVNADGSTTTLAGGGATTMADGVVATSAHLTLASDLAGGPSGLVYLIAGYAGSPAVWRIGGDGKLTHVAGNEFANWPNCSAAPNQSLQHARSVAVDRFGRVYVSGVAGLFKIRGDSQQQFIGESGGGSSDTLGAAPLAFALGSHDQIVAAGWDQKIRTSPPVAERENACRAAPYTTAAAAVDAQVIRFHAAATAATKAAWADAVYRTTTDPAELVDTLEHRTTFAGVVGPVSRLYRAAFGRPADTPGLRYWANKRFSGVPLATIATAFTTSAEFVHTYGSLSNSAFVDLVYLNVLGRPADSAGRTYWTSKLNSGTSRGSVLTAFSESAEFVTKQRVQTEATLATYGLLGRVPTSAEVSVWTDRLAAGHSVADLIAWVWYSAEHHNRVKLGLG